MIFLEFSKRFFTFYFWELECFFVLKRCFSLRPFQWYIVRLATRTGSVSNSNGRITIFAHLRLHTSPGHMHNVGGWLLWRRIDR